MRWIVPILLLALSAVAQPSEPTPPVDPKISLRVDSENYRVAQMALGQSLCGALATGQAWLPDEAKLRRLAAVNKVPSLVHEAERYLEEWNRRPLTLGISCSPLFDAHFAQYTFHSMDALKQKLTQFPAGTRFVLWWPSIDEGNQPCINEIRAFLTDHGMSLEDEKRPE